MIGVTEFMMGDGLCFVSSVVETRATILPLHVAWEVI